MTLITSFHYSCLHLSVAIFEEPFYSVFCCLYLSTSSTRRRSIIHSKQHVAVCNNINWTEHMRAYRFSFMFVSIFYFVLSVLFLFYKHENSFNSRQRQCRYNLISICCFTFFQSSLMHMEL